MINNSIHRTPVPSSCPSLSLTDLPWFKSPLTSGLSASSLNSPCSAWKVRRNPGRSCARIFLLLPQVTQTLQPPGILYLWKGAASLLYCRSNWVNELQLQISFQTETRTEKLNKITTSYFSEHLCAVSHFVNFKRFVVGTQEPKNNIKSFNHWPFISSYQIHY